MGPERRPGVVAQAVDAIAEVVGEGRRGGSAQGDVPDRARRAHLHRAPGHLDLLGGLGLAGEHRVPVGGVAHHETGCDLAGGIAVDAAGVDEPVPVCGCRMAILDPRHTGTLPTGGGGPSEETHGRSGGGVGGCPSPLADAAPMGEGGCPDRRMVM